MLEGLQQWTNGILESNLDSPIFFLAVFAMGLVAAVGSCCNVGVIAAVSSYAGSEVQGDKKRNHLKTGISFLLGNILSLSLVGALTGFVSVSIGAATGQYWMLFAGVIMVYFGLLSLDMLPNSFRFGNKLPGKINGLANKGFLFGVLLGGFATACSVSCNPIFPVIMGASYLQGDMLWALITLLIFAIGYSLPIGMILIGVGFGADRMSNSIKHGKNFIRALSGGLLILIGFGLILGWI